MASMSSISVVSDQWQKHDEQHIELGVVQPVHLECVSSQKFHYLLHFKIMTYQLFVYKHV